MRVPTKLRRHSTSMPKGAIRLSPTSTSPLTTHQHSKTMRISHMEEEHSKFKDLDIICSNIMPHLGSNNNCSNQIKMDAIAGHKLLSFMDAFSGYNQIKMDPSDQEKTSFMTG